MNRNFEVYKTICNPLGVKMDEDAALEVSERLWQLSHALDQMNFYVELHDSYEIKDPTDHHELIRQGDLLFKNARFYVESYYYFAHRIYKILTHKDRPLPYLQSFKCKGVLLVRNNLIEHPDKKPANATFTSYTYDRKTGFRLRTSGNPQQAVHDKGIIFNSHEFEINFDRVVEQAISKIRQVVT
jgi:hypothetical protein